MIEEGLRLVFRAMREHEVSCLLMGGQACVLYGAAEFSRDVDFAILAEAENLERVQAAMHSLEAEVIAVPPFEIKYLEEGLAVHFRCSVSGADGLRVDLMTRMRGVADFPELWERRFSIDDGGTGQVHLMHVADLVAAKKTQRDKDWPMIQRLLEVNYLSCTTEAVPAQIDFWLRELRTPELLLEAAGRFPEETATTRTQRPLLAHALNPDPAALERELNAEMLAEKARDRKHWEPLKQKLSNLRHPPTG